MVGTNELITPLDPFWEQMNSMMNNQGSTYIDIHGNYIYDERALKDISQAVYKAQSRKASGKNDSFASPIF